MGAPCLIPAVHFLFGIRSEEKDKDNTETISLKNNPILIALSEGRLPEERPNYEYFRQILALNGQVTVRPKRCWIFVSNQDVVVREDGSGLVQETNDSLDENDYPHLARNLERESWAKEEQQIFKGALLHEFTKEMAQVDASTVNELSNKSEEALPELHRRLKAICATTDAKCTILHMNVTLEVKDKRGFPSHSELNSWVEMNIEQPRLLNHRWKVHTRLVRPAELSYSHGDSTAGDVYETSAEIAIQYQHRPGCEGPRHCISQRCRRDWVTVPFPADVWAETLTNCAEYPAHPLADGKRHDCEREVKREEDGSEGPKSSRRTRQPTQMDLVPKIAMMQEIWSCPSESAHEQTPFEQGDNNTNTNSSRSQKWTRRAVIFWTFQTQYSIKENKLETAQSGKTTWRFLTILDPTSEYHQQRAIISPSRRASTVDEYPDPVMPSNNNGHPRPVSRDLVLSPSPTYQQHMDADMSETFSTAWDSSSTGLSALSNSAAQAYGAHLLAQTTQSAYDPLAGFTTSHSGLATPPPSASLTTTFTHNFDGTSQSDFLPSYLATTAEMNDGQQQEQHQATLNSLAAVTDPFLTSVGSSFDVSYDQSHWSATRQDTQSWPYPAAPDGGVLDTWNNSVERHHSLYRLSTGSIKAHHHHNHQHQHHQHPVPRPPPPPPPPQPWVVTSNDGNQGNADEDLWTPVSSSSSSTHGHMPITSAVAVGAGGLDDAAVVGQEWVHAITGNGNGHARSGGGGEGEERSQGQQQCQQWEALGNSGTQHLGLTIELPVLESGDRDGNGIGIGVANKSLKRGRSDSFDDELDGADGYGGFGGRRESSRA